MFNRCLFLQIKIQTNPAAAKEKKGKRKKIYEKCDQTKMLIHVRQKAVSNISRLWLHMERKGKKIKKKSSHISVFLIVTEWACACSRAHHYPSHALPLVTHTVRVFVSDSGATSVIFFMATPARFVSRRRGVTKCHFISLIVNPR